MLSASHLRVISLLVLAISGCRTASRANVTDTAESTLSVAAPNIFFHWGSVAANNSLLQAGGYQGTYNHEFNGLADDRSEATVSAGMINVVRTWYEKGQRHDAAGAGLYVADEPANTASYGDSVLIVERRGEASGPIPFRNQFKLESDRALDTHQTDKLPYMVSYTSETPDSVHWYVIPRSPARADAATLVMYPPKGASVALVAAAILGSPLPNRLPRTAADVVSALANLKQARTSQIFLQRLFYDYWLAPLIARSGTMTAAQIIDYAKILGYMTDKHAADARTVQLSAQMNAGLTHLSDSLRGEPSLAAVVTRITTVLQAIPNAEVAAAGKTFLGKVVFDYWVDILIQRLAVASVADSADLAKVLAALRKERPDDQHTKALAVALESSAAAIAAQVTPETTDLVAFTAQLLSDWALAGSGVDANDFLPKLISGHWLDVVIERVGAAVPAEARYFAAVIETLRVQRPYDAQTKRLGATLKATIARNELPLGVFSASVIHWLFSGPAEVAPVFEVQLKSMGPDFGILQLFQGLNSLGWAFDDATLQRFAAAMRTWGSATGDGPMTVSPATMSYLAVGFPQAASDPKVVERLTRRTYQAMTVLPQLVVGETSEESLAIDQCGFEAPALFVAGMDQDAMQVNLRRDFELMIGANAARTESEKRLALMTCWLGFLSNSVEAKGKTTVVSARNLVLPLFTTSLALEPRLPSIDVRASLAAGEGLTQANAGALPALAEHRPDLTQAILEGLAVAKSATRKDCLKDLYSRIENTITTHDGPITTILMFNQCCLGC